MKTIDYFTMTDSKILNESKPDSDRPPPPSYQSHLFADDNSLARVNGDDEISEENSRPLEKEEEGSEGGQEEDSDVDAGKKAAVIAMILNHISKMQEAKRLSEANVSEICSTFYIYCRIEYIPFYT